MSAVPSGISQANAAPTSDLSFAQLETLWEQAGGDPSKAPIAAAIAKAESGGDPTSVVAEKNGSTSYGLWQINSSHSFDLSQINDPLYNAQQAVSVSGNGADFSPWTTYWSWDGGVTNAGNGNGIFQKFLPGGTGNAGSAAQSWFGQLESTALGALQNALGGSVANASKAVVGFGLLTPIALILGIGLVIGAIVWAGEESIGGNIGDALKLGANAIASNAGAAAGAARGAHGAATAAGKSAVQNTATAAARAIPLAIEA